METKTKELIAEIPRHNIAIDHFAELIKPIMTDAINAAYKRGMASAYKVCLSGLEDSRSSHVCHIQDCDCGFIDEDIEEIKKRIEELK